MGALSGAACAARHRRRPEHHRRHGHLQPAAQALHFVSDAFKLKTPVTMRLSEDAVEYFKGMAAEAGVPYQSLINLYLRDCLVQNRRVQIKWPSAA